MLSKVRSALAPIDRIPSPARARRACNGTRLLVVEARAHESGDKTPGVFPLRQLAIKTR
jgi:hypothetical protein